MKVSQDDSHLRNGAAHSRQMWLYAIANAIESCINGTSSVRAFDASKLRTASGALDDHALPARRQKPLGLGFPLPTMPSIPSTPGNRRSMPPLGSSGHQPSDKEREREKRTRKTSFKNVLKSSGEKWLNRNSTSFDLPRPTPSAPSGRITPPPPTLSMISSASPTRSVKVSWEGYDASHDTAIEKRVYEMAGLGLGHSPISSPSQQRRVQSEGVHKHAEGQEMARSKSAEVNLEVTRRREKELSMRTLRELADSPGNNRCADCNRPTKTSQWATLSEPIISV